MQKEIENFKLDFENSLINQQSIFNNVIKLLSDYL